MRKRFFVYPRLQLRHLAWTLGVVFGAFSLGYLVFETLLFTSLAEGLAADVGHDLRLHLRIGFGVLSLIVLLAIGIENVLFFHRIVGPLYALSKGMDRLSAGSFDDPVILRESDLLGDIVAAFERMKASLKDRYAAQDARLQTLTDDIESLLKSPSSDMLPQLREKLKEFRARVEKQAA